MPESTSDGCCSARPTRPSAAACASWCAGGSRFDPSVGRDLFGMGFNIVQAYGLTECSGAATVTRLGDPHVDTVGHPARRRRDPHRARPGRRSRSRVRGRRGPDRGPIVMAGYHNRPDVNAVALADGWLHTGRPRLPRRRTAASYITGRKKEIIVLASGKNIYPEEIETHYAQSPFIKELCVMGVSLPGRAVRRAPPRGDRARPRGDAGAAHRQLPRDHPVRHRGALARAAPPQARAELRRLAGGSAADDDAEAEAPRDRAPLPRNAGRRADPRRRAGRMERRGRDLGGRTIAAGRWPPSGKPRRMARPSARTRTSNSTSASTRWSGWNCCRASSTTCGVDVPDEVAQRIFTVRELVEAHHARCRAPARRRRRRSTRGRGCSTADEPDPVLAGIVRPKPVFSRSRSRRRTLNVRRAPALGLRVAGLEHLPRSGPFIFCPNHQSYLDAFLLVGALPYGPFKRLFFVGASEYFETPVTRRLA